MTTERWNVKSGTSDPFDYASKGWFPINEQVLNSVKKKLSEGGYEGKREELISDLKADFSLFAHCLRQLGTKVTKEEKLRNPIELLRSLEFERLKDLLHIPEGGLSVHTFNPQMKFQNSRIKQLLVSCSTAETLGEAKQLDPDMAFSCALVRQLGMTLIAFNYPRIYTQALSSLKSERDNLESKLARILGYSPTQLGIKIALGWNENLQLRKGLGDNSMPSADDNPLMAYKSLDEEKKGEELRRVCEIGEALAAAGDSDLLPPSPKKWEEAISEIKKALGPDGLKLINERIGKYQKEYVAVASELFSSEVVPEQTISALQAQYGIRLLSQNQAVLSCSPAIKAEFEEVYKLIKGEEVSTQAVGRLVISLLPLIGFPRGCIYLADMKAMRLVPTVRVGRSEISDFKVLSFIDVGHNPHPAVEAMHTALPIRQVGAVVSGNTISHITGMFGNAERKGVLFLEMGADLANGERERSILYFKAVKKCLSDCLNLS